MDTHFGLSPEIKVPLGSFSCRWVNNIKMGFRATGCARVEWNEVARRKRETFLLYGEGCSRLINP
jgi:hypothetical protein